MDLEVCASFDGGRANEVKFGQCLVKVVMRRDVVTKSKQIIREVADEGFRRIIEVSSWEDEYKLGRVGET